MNEPTKAQPDRSILRFLDRFHESNQNLIDIANRYEDLLKRIQGDVPQEGKTGDGTTKEEPTGYLDHLADMSDQRDQLIKRIEAVLNRLEEHF